MNIIEVAEQKDQIMARQDIECPGCDEPQFSLMDKVFTVAFDVCIMCHPWNEEFERRIKNIVAVIGD